MVSGSTPGRHIAGTGTEAGPAGPTDVGAAGQDARPDPAPDLMRGQVSALGALEDPTRRALYELVIDSPAPLTRDQAAARQGIPRSTATFHLERLVEVGLLRATFAKLSGRTGPGSGRPAKLYAPAPDEIAVSMPPRHYDLAARVLAGAVERSAVTGGPVIQALAESAAAAGRELAAGSASLLDVLRRNGFHPQFDDADRVVLGNCPFHRLVEDHPETVCTLNLHLLRGAAEATGEAGLDLALEPAPGRCCVTVRGLGCPGCEAAPSDHEPSAGSTQQRSARSTGGS